MAKAGMKRPSPDNQPKTESNKKNKSKNNNQEMNVPETK